MKEILISPHNPVTGPRHLGHYVSSIKELKHLQDKYECFVLIDDLLAYFMYPKDRINMLNRSFYNVRDFLAADLDTKKVHFVLTSMIPESLELMTILNAFVDMEYCRKLYSESFLGLLKSYHRTQQGLEKYPSITELVYPQMALPSLIFGLRANIFQGGEEINGYIYIMEEIARSFNMMYGSNLLSAPHLLSPHTPYLIGTDGKYMITENSLLISSSPEDIKSTVEKITDNEVLHDWYDGCGSDKAHSISKTGVCTKESKDDMYNFLTKHLEPFRTYKINNKEILEILTDGANYAKNIISDTTSEIKSVLNIPTF